MCQSRRLETAEAFARTVLHIVSAIFAQLGHTSYVHISPQAAMTFKVSGHGNLMFKYVFIEADGSRRVAVQVHRTTAGSQLMLALEKPEEQSPASSSAESQKCDGPGNGPLQSADFASSLASNIQPEFCLKSNSRPSILT